MLKQKALTLLAGMALLFGGASAGNATGLTLDSQLVRGAVLGTADPFDPFINPGGAGFIELTPGFITGGGQTQIGLVSVTRSALTLPGFQLTAGPAGNLIGNTDGTSATEFFMDDTSGDEDLIEFLFTLTVNQGGITDSSMVILSLVGDFGSDPLGTPTTLGGLGTGAASLTLTEVNAIPLPASVLLLMTSLGGLFMMRRRRSA